MKYLKRVTTVQLEISSMCNALCLGCQRVDTSTFNGVNASIPAKETISLDTIKSLFTSNAMQHVDKIEFCGTIDEPLMHPQFLEIIDMLYDINSDYEIVIHTNGSLRPELFWETLAHQLSAFKKHMVFFSIDGLRDTNHIYRQNTDFDKIIKNAVAFNSAGGISTWQFIVFPWNAHQLDTAKQLSRDYKFSQFRERNDRSGVTDDGLDYIQQLQEKNISIPLRQKARDYSKFDNMDISCFSQEDNMMFVSYDSKLWPCCFFGNVRYMSVYDDFKKRIFDVYGEDFNDLTLHSADAILESDLYTNDLVASWSNNVGCGKTDKVNRCAMTCSVRALNARPIASAHIYTKNSC